MVKEMSSRMNLFVAGLGRASSKEVRAAMMIDGMDISLLIVYVQQVEDEKLREREEYRKKKAKTRNEFGQVASSVGQEVHFMKQCPKNKQGGGNPGNRAQYSSSVPLERVAPRGATSDNGGGANRLYAITSR
ncbi:uncharacterized protein LOC107003928 [Solanum pennellii]|uniref:Uncharacterized protein LOC107003928 n=1 Tax=Solanum pennellii TaxID=28526 RepID=A0ABM1FJ60_SOLPN|nr:uncharacterized protein LOC107003928 [Solanum pennellii]